MFLACEHLPGPATFPPVLSGFWELVIDTALAGDAAQWMSSVPFNCEAPWPMSES